jgi:DNA-binding MarR family transcriptional regulator
MQNASSHSRSFLDGLSYVLASRQREAVLAAVVPGPKTPVQVARQTGLHLPHVSRTLSQLVHTDLVERVAGQRRGRLYAASNLGQAVFGQLAEERGDRVVAPMVRGAHLRNYHHWVAANFGADAANEILIRVGFDPASVGADNWYPLRFALDAMEKIEARFGDGTYTTVRKMLREEAGNFSSARRIIARVLPFTLLLELSPNAYSREFNHGRLEVEVQDHQALMKNYDWLSSPARCAAWQGAYEGFLSLIGIDGTVTKVACMLRGDPYCGYRLDW